MESDKHVKRSKHTITSHSKCNLYTLSKYPDIVGSNSSYLLLFTKMYMVYKLVNEVNGFYH